MVEVVYQVRETSDWATSMGQKGRAVSCERKLMEEDDVAADVGL